MQNKVLYIVIKYFILNAKRLYIYKKILNIKFLVGLDCMARSAKDLRNIINISRLSLRNETSSDEISENDEVNENDQCNNSTTLTIYLLSRPSSALSESSFSTLSFSKRPNTAYKKRTAVNHFLKRPSSAPADQVVKSIITNQNACKPYSKRHETLPDWKNKNIEDNFDDILKFVDGTIVNSWLEELNTNLKDLILFFKTNDNFVEFSEFFLNKLPTNQLNKLLDLEFSIIVDQLKYAFHAGFEGGYLKESNIFVLAQAVVKEYPKKLKGSKGCEVLLDIILVFCNGKNDNYRSLLRKVVCKVKSKQHIHWLLAFRAFSLINLANGVITFFKKVQLVCDSAFVKNNICTSNYPVKDWMIQAVKKGYRNVCLFFLSRHKEYSYNSMYDDKSRNLLFIAIAERNKEMAEFLLPV